MSNKNQISKTKTKLETVQYQQIQQYEGPLPTAEQLEKYENLLTGAADRIITMAEKEQEHFHQLARKELELAEKEQEQSNTALKAIILNSRLGIVSAFILCLTTLCFGGFLIFMGFWRR